MALAIIPEISRRMRGRAFYGCWLESISGFIMVIATMPLFHAMNLRAVALEHQLGWNRTQLGLALTLTRVEGGIIGPVEGCLTDRVVTRHGLGRPADRGRWFPTIRPGTQPVDVLPCPLVMTMGQGLGSWVPMMTLLNHWFTRRRAIAISWANVGSRMGALLLVPAIAWAIEPDQGRLGWSVTASLLGVLLISPASTQLCLYFTSCNPHYSDRLLVYALRFTAITRPS